MGFELTTIYLISCLSLGLLISYPPGSSRSHGVPQPLSQRPFDIQKLSVRGKRVTQPYIENLRPMGRLFSLDPVGQCLSAGCG